MTFFQRSRYQAEEQANRGTAEACHFHSSICDPDPSSEGDWDTCLSVSVCVYIYIYITSGTTCRNRWFSLNIPKPFPGLWIDRLTSLQDIIPWVPGDHSQTCEVFSSLRCLRHLPVVRVKLWHMTTELWCDVLHSLILLGDVVESFEGRTTIFVASCEWFCSGSDSNFDGFAFKGFAVLLSQIPQPQMSELLLNYSLFLCCFRLTSDTFRFFSDLLSADREPDGETR